MRAIRHKATTVQKDNRKKKGETTVYPHGGSAPLRTHERHLQLADRANQDDGPDYYGVKEGRSFLVTILPELNIIDHLVIDYMHNCLLGIFSY